MSIYSQPYTYLIGWTHLNKYYYGVRFAKGCKPSDLWVSYFTSSKTVLELRRQEGEPDLIEIRKTFDCKLSAIAWEEKVLRRMNVLKEDKWLNKNIAGAILPHDAGKKNKGRKRSQESIEKAIETKKKNGKPNKRKGMKMPQISAALKGRPNPNKGKKFGPMTEETKAKMAASRRMYYATGGKGPNSGKTMSEEQKLKISNSSRGRTKSEQTKQKMREAKLAYYSRMCLSSNDSNHGCEPS